MNLERHRVALNKIFKNEENPPMPAEKQQALLIAKGNQINAARKQQNIKATGGPVAKRRIEVKEKKL